MTAFPAATPRRPAIDHDGPPTTERGRSIDSLNDFTGMMPWGQWADDVEQAPQLKWPFSIKVFDDMGNDSQCQGLYLGATAAIQRYIWYLDPNGCSARWVKALAADLNLPVGLDAAIEASNSSVKRSRFRTKKRFSWYDHLALALKALKYGHYFFEQVGEIRSDGPGGKPMWHLTKLAPRHPRTITELLVTDGGSLLAVRQGYDGTPFPGIAGGAGRPPIPISQLVCYVWDQEPGNWVGRSMYRPMYRNYLVKDRLLRVDAIKHERNGVGMPVIEAPEGASEPQIQDLDKMAQEYKVGERGGGALPHGAKLTLQGTTGTLPDTLASMRFQNEEMARSMLMMFMQLGQTETGSRALGKTFIDWFSIQQEMIADWIADTANEHIIEDWWDWNVNPDDDQVPLLAYYKGPSAAAQEDDFKDEKGNPADLPDEGGQGSHKDSPDDAEPPAGGTATASRVPVQTRAPGATAENSNGRAA